MGFSKTATTIISIVSGGMIWLYIALFFVLTYLLISLLTWSFIKPLKYLGIPTIFVGILFIIIRFSANSFVELIEGNTNIIKILLPSVLKPILINGILCVVFGILMMALYVVINKVRNKKEIIN